MSPQFLLSRKELSSRSGFPPDIRYHNGSNLKKNVLSPQKSPVTGALKFFRPGDGVKIATLSAYSIEPLIVVLSASLTEKLSVVIDDKSIFSLNWTYI